MSSLSLEDLDSYVSTSETWSCLFLIIPEQNNSRTSVETFHQLDHSYHRPPYCWWKKSSCFSSCVLSPCLSHHFLRIFYASFNGSHLHQKKHAENPIRNHPRNVMKGSKGLELRKYFKVWPWSVEGCAKVVKGNRPVSWFTLVFQIPPEKVF